MKKTVLLFATLVLPIAFFGQCPSADIVLTSQAEIDNFTINYPGCTMLTHNVKVDGAINTITNVNGFSDIVGGQNIFIQGTQISDLYGLHNLETAGHLALWGNPNLQNLEGLTALQTAVSLEVFVNAGITDLSGMDSIQSFGNVSLFGNGSLVDITHLSFLETLTSLTIGTNALTTFAGLENLHTIEEDFNISNEAVINVDALSNLQSIGGSLFFIGNSQLTDISGLSNIQALVDLYIVETPNLANLSGLENIQSFSGKLRIGFNPQLTDLSVFSNITSVRDLDVYENENLLSLDGLENLEEIQQRLFINGNPLLNSIAGIGDVSPEGIEEVVIFSNPNLTVCNVPLICTVVNDPAVAKTIFDNQTGCNSVQEVQDSCLLGVNDDVLVELVSIYPVPASDFLTISLSETMVFEKAVLYSVTGQKIWETSEKVMSLSAISSGIYFVEVETDKGSIVKKIVKE